MASLNREELSILLLLRDSTLSHKIYMPIQAIGRSFSPPISGDVVQAAAEHLIEEQFAETDGRERYRVSHLGSEVARITLETQLGKDPEKDRSLLLTRSHWQFEDRPRSAFRKNMNKSIDWTKWGTIIGAAGVLVTILVAVLF